jgi:hypothetical protein
VHRDIKPSNLLVDRNGQIKVLDLGLARLDVGAPTDSPSELTTSGVIMGTVDFMAPEQGNDSRRADARSDIYSLGCTLFYLLTGRSPYAGDGLLDRVVAHRLKEIPKLRTFCPAAPDSLARILTRCLAKNPDDRYRSMSELIVALEACAQTMSSRQKSDRKTDNPVRLKEQVAGAKERHASASVKSDTTQTIKTETSSAFYRFSRGIAAGAVASLVILLIVAFVSNRGAPKPAPNKFPEAADRPVELPAQQSDEKVPPGASSQIADGDWGLSAIKHPEFLEFLTTTDRVTPEGMKYLSRFPRLRHLEWNGPAMDESLASLAELTELEVLSIAAGPGFHGSGLKYLRKCRQLNFLKLSGSGLDDDGFQSLPELPLLGKLGINHTKVGDRGLAALARCPELEQIGAHFCPAITDAGLSHFAGLTKLSALNLEACPQVTDAGLEHLAKINSLVWINLRGTGVTKAGAQRLQTATPRRKMIFEGLDSIESP